jgi:hypothetical protein
MHLDWCMLLPAGALCFLNVCEVGVTVPSNLELQRFPQRIRDRRDDLERSDSQSIGEQDVEAALRQAALIPRLVVAGLAAGAAAVQRHFRK